MTFAVLCDSDGGITFMSYDWTRIIKVPACLFVACNLFDESRPGFDWGRDSELAADICRVMLETEGFTPKDWSDYPVTIRSGGKLLEFKRALQAVCEPGGPGPLHAIYVEMEAVNFDDA